MKTWVKEHKVFCVFWLFMTGYYIYRMFTIGMLYDELYTGRCLIYRGIVYCVVDWRLPNNHIFYSELSWLLSLFGNKTIAIRGIAVMAASLNLILLYRLVNQLTHKKRLSEIAVLLYAASYMVIYQAAQGRGYTLSTTLLLAALLLLRRICMDKEVTRWTWLGYGVMLALGIYTLTSNLYFVMMLSLTGGLFLLCRKQWKTLGRLIGASVFGAAVTFILYVPTILGMGMMSVIREMNGLGERDAISSFGSSDMLQTILHYPVRCFRAGIHSMTTNGYVMSRDMAYIMEQYKGYVADFADNFFQIGTGVNMLLIVCVVGSALLLWIYCVIKNKKLMTRIRRFEEKVQNSDITANSLSIYVGTEEKKQITAEYEHFVQKNSNNLFMASFTVIAFALIFLMPFVQKVVSPARTFTYMAVPFAIGMVLIVQQGALITKKNLQLKQEEPVLIGIALFSLLICVCSQFSSKALNVWAANEKETYDAIVATDAFSCEKAYIGTIFGKGQIWFETGKEIEELSDEPECVILLKEQTDPAVTEEIYQAQTTYEDVPWQWIEENMTQSYENEKVVAWVLK